MKQGTAVNEIPSVDIEPARRSFFDRFSIVWLVPIAALIIALGIAYNSWSQRGPIIEITFSNAAGVTANETQLRYRDVAVGVVEKVGFTSDLSKVRVSVRTDKDIARFLDDSAEFWVVRPQVSASGISGLETVLSGVYIEASWDDQPGAQQFSFQGLDQAPLVTRLQSGLKIQIRAVSNKGLGENTSILYKGIEVGKMGRARISEDGAWVLSEGIIYSPHDRLVTSATRFWNTSGFSFSLGPNGAQVDFDSLASLVTGGIAFDTLVSGGSTVSDGATFQLYSDENAARRSIFDEGDDITVNLSMVFEENSAGLATGAAVEWQGVKIGQVTEVTGIVDTDQFGDDRVRLLSTVEVHPGRFGLTGEVSDDEVLDFLSSQIQEGLRARLVTASIITGGLKMEFVNVENAEPASLDRSNQPYPLFPVTQSDISDVSASAEGLFKRINSLPIEDLLNSAINFLDNATRLVASDDTQAIPGEVKDTIADIRNVLGSDAVQSLPDEISGVMSDVRSATSDLQRILQSVEQAQIVAKVGEAVTNVGDAAKGVENSIAGVPEIIQRVDTIVANAEDVRLDVLAVELEGLLVRARQLFGEAVESDLPESLSLALRQAELTLKELRDGGLIKNANETMASARDAAASIQKAADELPALVSKVEATLDQADRTLSAYQGDSSFGRDATSALREIRKAAQSVGELADAIRRQPNSLILGR